MILLIGGEKGGPGKTTIATNLAAMRTDDIEDVLLVDTDRQPTSSYWCSLREDNGIFPRVASIQKYDKSVRTEVLELMRKYTDPEKAKQQGRAPVNERQKGHILPVDAVDFDEEEEVPADAAEADDAETDAVEEEKENSPDNCDSTEE